MIVRRPLFALVLGGISAGCLIDRSSIEGSDDAFVAMGTDASLDARGSLDVGTDPFDATVDAAVVIEPDAYVARDAYVTPDAFAPDTGCNGGDADGDGLRDPCDPWPCGASQPTVVVPVAGEFISIDNVSLAGGSNVIVASSGASVAVTLDFAINDTACGGCRDQIEIGTVPGSRFGCIYDANPPPGGASGTWMQNVPMPTVSAPTLVDLRFNLRQDFGCGADWWAGAPGPAQTFGAVCVVP
jgi:hypothetical protein